nr:MAG TPA: hypothetical protein [Caudoviricetes sp.]
MFLFSPKFRSKICLLLCSPLSAPRGKLFIYFFNEVSPWIF